MTTRIRRGALRLATLVPLILLGATRPGSGAAAPGAASPAADVAAARAVFERNLQAIRDKNRDGYLACYLQSDNLARTGVTGPEMGYKGLAAAVGQGWPDHFVAEDLRLVPVQPGIVYGTYRYRVRTGGEESAGLSERLFVNTPKGWKIAVTTAFQNLIGVPPPPRALVGATLLDGRGGPPLVDAVIVIRDARIDCVGTRAACPVPAGIEVVDLKGQWITPGLVDAHVHFSQTGWADGRPDALDVRAKYPYEQTEEYLRLHPDRFGRTYLCSGVTAVFDVGGYPWTLDLPRRFRADTEVPSVVVAGPLLSTRDHWLNLPAERQFIYLTDADVGRSGVRYLASQGSQAVKVWFIPGKDRTIEQMAVAVRAAGEEAKRLGLPLIVHSTGLEEAKAALKAGAHLLVHSVWDKPIDQEFLDLVKANGTIYCPTLTVARGYVRMFTAAAQGKAPAVDDPNGCVDPVTLAKVAATATAGTGGPTAEQIAARDRAIGEQERIAAANLKRVSDAGVTIVLGTDAGNPMTLHGPAVYAEMEAMQAAGMSPLQVLVAATRNGAIALGMDKDIGTVEKGKVADLLILGADPAADVKNLRQIRALVHSGVLRSIAELHALATATEK